jgi:hypothetical protein
MHPVVHLNLYKGLVRAADIGAAPLDRDTDVHDLGACNFECHEERFHGTARADYVIDNDHAVALVYAIEIKLAFRVPGCLVDRDLVRQVVHPFPA